MEETIGAKIDKQFTLKSIKGQQSEICLAFENNMSLKCAIKLFKMLYLE